MQNVYTGEDARRALTAAANENTPVYDIRVDSGPKDIVSLPALVVIRKHDADGKVVGDAVVRIPAPDGFAEAGFLVAALSGIIVSARSAVGSSKTPNGKKSVKVSKKTVKDIVLK